jgi:hypothetical protein
MTPARSLQKKSNNDTADDGESTGTEAGSGAYGNLRGDSGDTRSLSRDNGRGEDGGRRLSRDDERGGRVDGLDGAGGAGGPDRGGGGGVESEAGGGDDRDLGGGGGRARGESDGLDAGLGGHDDAAVLTLVVAAVLTTILGLDDVERVGVLEDAGVTLVPQDEAVDGLVTKSGIDSPGVLVVSIGNAAGNVGDGDLSALGRTTDQVDRDSTGGILLGSLPGDLEGRASNNVLVGLRRVDGVEVGGLLLSDGSSGHGQEGGNSSEEAHLDWLNIDLFFLAKNGCRRREKGAVEAVERVTVEIVLI